MDHDSQLFVWSQIDDYGLNAEEFRVLARIARRGECTESAGNMAKGLLICERTVRMAIRVLSVAGAITELERTGNTTVRKIQPVDNWIDKTQLPEIRQQLKANWKKRDTPAPDTGLQQVQPSPVTGTALPLHLIQRGAATGTAKGDPIKEIQEGNPVKVKSKRGARSTAKPETTEDEFLNGLQESGAYPGIDVRLEHKKAANWCNAHARENTRRFFVGWVGRAKPTNGNGVNGNGYKSKNDELNDSWRQFAQDVANTTD